MNKKLYTVACILITASLVLLNIAYAANAPVNATSDTAAEAKTSNIGAIVGGVAAATAVAGGITAAVISNTKNKDSSSSSDELDKQLQSILDKYRKEYNVPGLSMSVSLSPNSRTRNYVSGTTKLNGTQKLNSNTIFQIGSNTKAFTSSIILQLEAEGKLNIHDTLGKYLPNEYPEWNKVTLIQLMNMTSGVPEYFDIPGFDKDMLMNPAYRHKHWTLDEIANLTYKTFRDKNKNTNYPGLDFQPGTQWYYSNTGYFLLAMVIEKITGNTYKHELETRLIGKNAPYGIKNNYYIPDSPTNYPDYIKDNMAYAYYEDKSMYGNTNVHDVTDLSLSAGGPAGAIVSTLKDNITWDRNLFSSKVLPPTQQKELTNTCVQPPGLPIKTYYYCLGVAYAQDYQVTKNYVLKGKTWSYTGGYYGQNFAYELLPDNTVIVIAENANYVDHYLNVGVGPGDLVPEVIMAIENYKKTHPYFQK